MKKIVYHTVINTSIDNKHAVIKIKIMAIRLI